MPDIAILLCTYNGARFLPAQLASLAAQSFRQWRLFVSDDGSNDDTLAIVAEHKLAAMAKVTAELRKKYQCAE